MKRNLFAAEYFYFNFAYFYGKAFSRLADNRF